MLTWTNQPQKIPTSFLWHLQLSVFLKIENKQTEISWEQSKLSCCDHLSVHLEQNKEMKNCYFFQSKRFIYEKNKVHWLLTYSRELFSFLFSFTWKDHFCLYFLNHHSRTLLIIIIFSVTQFLFEPSFCHDGKNVISVHGNPPSLCRG